MTDLTVEQLQQSLKATTAQLDAAKQMVNEMLTSTLHLRTNVNLYQQALQELNMKNSQLTKELEDLKNVSVEPTV